MWERVVRPQNEKHCVFELDLFLCVILENDVILFIVIRSISPPKWRCNIFLCAFAPFEWYAIFGGGEAATYIPFGVLPLGLFHSLTRCLCVWVWTVSNDTVNWIVFPVMCVQFDFMDCFVYGTGRLWFQHTVKMEFTTLKRRRRQ